MNFNNTDNNENNTNMDEEDIFEQDIERYVDLYLNSLFSVSTQNRVLNRNMFNNDLDFFYYNNNNIIANFAENIFNSSYFMSDPIHTILEQSFEEQGDGLIRTNKNIIIPSRKYETLDNIVKEDNVSCCICLNEYKSEDEISVMNCNHIFHTDCIKEWGNYKTVPDCAICRDKLKI